LRDACSWIRGRSPTKRRTLPVPRRGGPPVGDDPAARASRRGAESRAAEAAGAEVVAALRASP
jgi:hypothetical protein